MIVNVHRKRANIQRRAAFTKGSIIDWTYSCMNSSHPFTLSLSKGPGTAHASTSSWFDKLTTNGSDLLLGSLQIWTDI